MSDASQASQQELWPDGGADEAGQAPDAANVTPCTVNDASNERSTRTRGSMLWAAYGDALGFISELVDGKGLERRTQGAPLDHLMAWERRVGGRWGVDVLLPPGSWSDDTQLRMAVSRSIGSHGFDAEAFARIELPVWLSYALGGGRASKAAARNLGKPSTLWYANTFADWTNAGGNGAAMRIQPHVWASHDLEGDYMLDVIADTVCTHGHPRAIVGACFHAATLAHCLHNGTVPDAETCTDIAAHVGDAVQLIEDHSTLGPVWSGLRERETGERFNDVWRVTVDELHHAIKNASDSAEATNGDDAAYGGIVDRLGLRDRAQQGSGILTTVAAVVLAATASKAHEGVVAAANAIGTDTDTIASMAGALLGACDDAADPPEEPLDSPYLRSEADRLVALSQGEQAPGHPYPDILTWSAPQTQADALVSDNGSLAVEGLGPVTRLGTDLLYTSREDFAWEWVSTNFGQTLLIKRRPEIRPLADGNSLTPTTAPSERPDLASVNPEAIDNDPTPPAAPAGKFTSGGEPDRRARPRPTQQDNEPVPSRGWIDSAVVEARKNISDDAALGSIIREVACKGSLGDYLNFMRIVRDDLRH